MKKKKIHKPKHIIRELKRIADRLKPMTYQVADRLYRPFWQDAEGIFYDIPAVDGEPKRRMVNRMITEHPWNHKRRLKKAFQQYGEPGAIGYIIAFQKEDDPIFTKS